MILECHGEYLSLIIDHTYHTYTFYKLDGLDGMRD